LYAEKARAYWKMKQHNLSNEMADKALLIDDKNVKALNYKGNFSAINKEYFKAETYYEKAIELDSEYSTVYGNLGNVLKNLGDYQKAKMYFLEAIKRNPYLAVDHNNFGNLLADMNETKAALKNYEKAISLDANFALPYSNLGLLYAKDKNYNKARELYEKALNIDPNYSNVYNNLGNLFAQIKDNQKAEESYLKALELNVDSAYAHFNLGRLYHNEGKYDFAIKAFKETIEIDKEYFNAYYELGLSYEAQGNNKLAIEYFSKYLDLVDGNNHKFFTDKAKSKLKELEKKKDSKLYESISDLVNEIKTILLIRDFYLTHYTTLSAAKELIINNSAFRLSEGSFLNDTSEGKELFKFLSLNNTELSISESEALLFVQKPFIGSFVSEKKNDDLTLWRMYGKEDGVEAKGCSITIEAEKLIDSFNDQIIPLSAENRSILSEEYKFYKVVYCDFKKRKRIFTVPGLGQSKTRELNVLMDKLLKQIGDYNRQNKGNLSQQNLRELLSGIAYLFKSIEYQYEHEFRLVIKGFGFNKKYNQNSTPPKVYIETNPIKTFITQITLGPKVEKAEEWAAALHYSLKEDNLEPKIFISRLPFK
jgi:tetratricopeptide (TPR) repeat protein